MAFSVEARLPFLDYRLFEFIFRLPSKFKIRNGYTKRVLRDGMSGVIPEKIRWRVGKLGFATPELSWQRTVLRSLIERTIKDDILTPFLIPEKAMTYLSHIQKYKVSDFAPWRWVNLYLWMKGYDLA
jgi:asparagine synthase (glutamine-hydrolysing)